MNHEPSTINPLDRAVAGVEGAALTSLQRQQMCALAREAWAFKRAAGHAGADFNAWRYEENFKACHKESLRACTQRDWPLLRAHFLRLLGRCEQARNLETRATLQAAHVAANRLRLECEAARDVIAMPGKYIEAISRARFKRPTNELSAREIWTLVFDLRRNAQGRRAKARRAAISDQPSAVSQEAAP